MNASQFALESVTACSQYQFSDTMEAQRKKRKKEVAIAVFLSIFPFFPRVNLTFLVKDGNKERRLLLLTTSVPPLRPQFPQVTAPPDDELAIEDRPEDVGFCDGHVL
jgi:hypothetical protein